MIQLLKNVFKKEEDRKGIDNVIRHKCCKGITMEHKRKEKKESSCIACVLFETYDEVPFGSFVFYIALNETYSAKYIHQSLNSPNNYADASRGNIGLKGIATKMMNLVQFISWVLVRDTSLCLCATKESINLLTFGIRGISNTNKHRL